MINHGHHSELVKLFFANGKYEESKFLIEWLEAKLECSRHEKNSE